MRLGSDIVRSIDYWFGPSTAGLYYMVDSLSELGLTPLLDEAETKRCLSFVKKCYDTRVIGYRTMPWTHLEGDQPSCFSDICVISLLMRLYQQEGEFSDLKYNDMRIWLRDIDVELTGQLDKIEENSHRYVGVLRRRLANPKKASIELSEVATVTITLKLLHGVDGPHGAVAALVLKYLDEVARGIDGGKSQHPSYALRVDHKDACICGTYFGTNTWKNFGYFGKESADAFKDGFHPSVLELLKQRKANGGFRARSEGRPSILSLRHALRLMKTFDIDSSSVGIDWEKVRKFVYASSTRLNPCLGFSYSPGGNANIHATRCAIDIHNFAQYLTRGSGQIEIIAKSDIEQLKAELKHAFAEDHWGTFAGVPSSRKKV
jgi:hypothetical protein